MAPTHSVLEAIFISSSPNFPTVYPRRFGVRSDNPLAQCRHRASVLLAIRYCYRCLSRSRYGPRTSPHGRFQHWRDPECGRFLYHRGCTVAPVSRVDVTPAMAAMLETLANDEPSDHYQRTPHWEDARAWGWIMESGRLTGTGSRHADELPRGIVHD